MRISAGILRISQSRRPTWVLGIAMVLAVPALYNGLELDDLITWTALRDDEIGVLTWFSFVDPERFQLIDAQNLPWWAHPELKVKFARPLAALTHWFDYRAFADNHWAMHLHSVLWYVSLVASIGILYRDIAGKQGNNVAILGMLIFAVSQAHAMNVGWLAARNSLIGATFAALTLYHHRKRRRDDRRASAWMGPLFFACGLAANEGVVVTFGYICADVFVHARNRRGVLATVPYAFVLAFWAMSYEMGGFGTAHGSFYLSPAEDPVAFVHRTIVHGVLVLAARFGLSVLDPLSSVAGAYVVACIGALGFLGMLAYVYGPRLVCDAERRSLGLGTIAACLSAGTTLPMDRGLLLISIGGCFLLADLITFGIASASSRSRWLAHGLIAVHLVASPLLFIPRVRSSAWVHGNVEKFFAGIFRIEGDASRAILLHIPSDLFMLYHRALQRREGIEGSRSVPYLYAGFGRLTLARVEDDTLELAADVPWLNAPLDQMLRRPPIALGTEIATPSFHAKVTATDVSGRPRAVRFAFPSVEILERTQLIRWHEGEPVVVALPQVGQSVDVPAIPAF